MGESKFEAMRLDPRNWKLGVIYSCAEDPRVIVRQRLPLGWTWNFANPWVLPGIIAAIFLFVGPVALAWCSGHHSGFLLAALPVASLAILMLLASRLSRDPLD